MKKYLLFTMFGFIATLPGSAQTGTDAPPEYRRYATQARLRFLQLDPGVAEAMSAVERYTADFRQAARFDTVTVALVFHLMPLPGGDAFPAAADLQAQIDRLNTDFFTLDHPYLAESYQRPAALVDTFGNFAGTEADRQPYRHEADRLEHFAEHAGRPLIRFCLATTDPNGQPSPGVLQPAVAARIWRTDDDAVCQTETGGSAAWPPARYCNVWVARLAGDCAGYAQLPGGPEASDGIVIDDRFFARTAADPGNPYRLGRTLTHLMGSYLNLYELWNELVPCADDYVDDTPIHNAPNAGLPAYGYMHVSTCDGNPAEMLSNLMDNTPDSAQYLFTWGQAQRMQAALSEGGPRGGLRLTATDCLPDGASGQRGAAQAAKTPLSATASAFDLRIFPNPATGRFTLEIRSDQAADADLRIFSAGGALIYRQNVPVYEGMTYTELVATSWAPGLYTVEANAGAHSATKMVMIEK